MLFPPLAVMATFILVSTLPISAATQQRCDSREISRRHYGRSCCGRATLFRTPLSSSISEAIGREGRLAGDSGAFPRARRGLLSKAQENDEGGGHGAEPWYAASGFWIQVAVVILTAGFVDAGYSRDWSRIGAISQEVEAQLRVAAYLVVPLSATLIWFIGKRKIS